MAQVFRSLVRYLHFDEMIGRNYRTVYLKVMMNDVCMTSTYQQETYWARQSKDVALCRKKKIAYKDTYETIAVELSNHELEK